MEFLNNGDNLFKFLVITGISMLVLSIAYPLEKGQKLGLEIKRLEGQNELLKFRATVLEKRIKQLETGSIYQHQKDSLINLTNEYKIATIENRNQAKIVSELIAQQKDFETFEFWLKWIGVACISLGFLLWGWVTVVGFGRYVSNKKSASTS